MAFMWLTLAAEDGLQQVMPLLSEVVSRMSEEDKAHAERRAREWKKEREK